jgi:hypothetical protein
MNTGKAPDNFTMAIRGFKDENEYGAPVGIRIFEALFQASNLEEAIDILEDRHNGHYRYAIGSLASYVGASRRFRTYE